MMRSATCKRRSLPACVLLITPKSEFCTLLPGRLHCGVLAMLNASARSCELNLSVIWNALKSEMSTLRCRGLEQYGTCIKPPLRTPPARGLRIRVLPCNQVGEATVEAADTTVGAKRKRRTRPERQDPVHLPAAHQQIRCSVPVEVLP